MKEVMKEVVVEEPHKAEVREVPVPELSGENEVLIQMKSAGVCGSDHHIYHGLNPCSTYPRIPGHENAGVVVKAGSAVTNVKVGDHVKKGDILCIIEAMKLMNEITAENDGEIVDICVENGQIVEYGQTIFKMI